MTFPNQEQRTALSEVEAALEAIVEEICDIKVGFWCTISSSRPDEKRTIKERLLSRDNRPWWMVSLVHAFLGLLHIAQHKSHCMFV